MDAFRGVTLTVAGGPILVDEELPPQPAREKLMANQHSKPAARRVVLKKCFIRMILEANLARAQVQPTACRRYPLSTLYATLSCLAGGTVRFS